MRLGAGVRLGPYEVLGLIGAGGMAEVYRARDTRLGREVAVKVVSETLGSDEAFVERFEREARLVGSVNHPNVVALYDVGIHDGKPYFVTELLQGETLRTRLDKGAVPLPTALNWATQMAEGLAAAHECGIVHRDLKPENVLLTRAGHVKLLDFGIAKVIAAAQEPQPPGEAGPRDLLDETVPSASGRTGTGVVIGTPGYMSPEQVRGDPVDARSDLFSLGAVLHELLCGQRTFFATSAVECGYAILHEQPRPLPATVPSKLAHVVHRCLEKDPGRRFQSAQEVAEQLELLRAPASFTREAEARARPGRGRRWWITALAVLSLVAAVGLLSRTAPGSQLFSALRRRAGAEPRTPAGPGRTPSIAVLPFVNLSSDKEQEYFSDGITEELMDALARVKGLKVAGRTASFYFKGKNEEIHTIGKTLGVANVLEGSVRKQGNRVRITTQLIQVADGFHLWSRTFDGDLTDVFDLQEKIARAITNELKVVLQGDQGDRLAPVATSNPEAHALYLQATAIFSRRERLPDVVAELEQALRLDPGYARAWSRLASAWVLMPSYTAGEFEPSLVSAEKAAQRAIELDPSLAEAHAVLGLAYGYRRKLLEARAELRRALEIDPEDVNVNFYLATRSMSDGYGRLAKQLLDKVLTLDPMHPNGLHWRGRAAFVDGDLELAERLFRRSHDTGLSIAGLWHSSVTDARGQHEQAVAQLTAGLTPLTRDLPTGMVEAIARGAFGGARSREQALVLIKRHLATRPTVVSGAVPYALILLGQPGPALELLAQGPTRNDIFPLPVLWGPEGREIRKLAAFPEFCRRAGLVELWEREGAPDLCRRIEPQRYVCQ